jgi:hypothetical protein
MSMTTSSSDGAVKTRLRVVGLIAVAYFFLGTGWLTLLGRIGWHSVSAVFLIVSPFALRSVWRQRDRLTESDWRMLYWPLIIWLVSFSLFKYAVWAFTRGHSVLNTYGGDKGFSNVVVEPGFIGLITLAYLVAVPKVTSSRRRSVMLFVALVASALTTVLIPPLPE